MKKICLAFLVCSLIACNNNKSSETVSKDSTSTSETSPAGKAGGNVAAYTYSRKGRLLKMPAMMKMERKLPGKLPT